MIKNIGVSAIEFDPLGARVMRQGADQELDNNRGARRTTRTATLDGGCEIYDTGYAPADRTIRVATGLEHLDWLARMVRLYNTVRVSTEAGCFLGTPRNWQANNNKAMIEILVTEEM